jgi:acylphosphatase
MGELTMADVHHEIVFFTGRVQGVGFRYSTLQVAREYDVSGYVKNLADGRVQLEVEGREEEVEAFISALEQRMHGYVRKMERSAEKRAAQFSGFAIR